MNKIRQILKDILYVSKLTKIQRKKVRILFSAVISNSISFADIVIILTFSSLLTDSEITSNQYLDFITNNPILIVFIVIIRYVLNFLGKYNVYSLTKDIRDNFDKEEILQIFEYIWSVVLADGKIDDFEAALMSKLVGLFHLTGKESAEAKKKAMSHL